MNSHLETTLAGSVVDGVDLTIISGVGEPSLSLDAISLEKRYIKLTSQERKTDILRQYSLYRFI